MKVCPVCNARAFDDATTCYGCLHRFDEEDFAEESFDASAETGLDGFEGSYAGDAKMERFEQHVVQADDSVCAPMFLLRFTPAFDERGGVTWSCAVETG